MSAVEKYDAPTPAEITDREWKSLERQAAVLAKSSLVPAAYKDKPEDILAVALTARDLDMALTTTTLAHFYVIEGKVTPSAQLMVGLANRAGHEMWFEMSSDKEALVAVCRQGSKREQKFAYTIEMARRAGLTDIWVERWVASQSGKKYPERFVVGNDLGVDQALVAQAPEWAKKLVSSGQVKQKDNWHKYPEAMLMARAATRACRAVCPDVLLGLDQHGSFEDEPPAAPDGVDPETGEVLGGGERPQDPAGPAPAAPAEDPSDVDEDIADAEIVTQEEAGPVRGSADADAPPGPRVPAGELEHLLARIADLPSDWWRTHLKGLWSRRVPSLKTDEFTEEHLPEAHKLIDEVEAEIKAVDDERRKHANAAMSNVGIRGDEERHAFVHAATDGETSSTKGLTGPQLKAIVDACEKYGTTLPTGESEQPAMDLPAGEEPF